MLVEMYEISDYWYFKDENNLEATTGLGSTVKPLEAKHDTKDKLKTVIKLKEEGFKTEEIIELFESGVL